MRGGCDAAPVSDRILFEDRFAVDDVVLSRLHAAAFGGPERIMPWRARLERFSATWTGAFADGALVGFAHACWDGGLHAFLLDVVVAPQVQRRRIGERLVERVAAGAREAGCEWLHVDFEPHLEAFYRERCGFRSTAAGLLRLSAS